MPISLQLAKPGPFTVYRDSAGRNPVSVLTWLDPEHLGRVISPHHQRKNLFAGGAFEETLSPTIDARYFTQVKTTHAVNAYWRFGDTTSTALDISNSAASPGVYTGAYTLWQPGAIGGDPDRAVALNGATGYISVAHTTFVNIADSFTLECWVKRAATGVAHYLFSKGTNAAALRIGTDNKLILEKQGVADIVASTTTITDNNWHHVAVTKNGAASIALYIDGVDRTGTVTNQTCVANGNVLNIGRKSDNTGFFNGLLDEVAIKLSAMTVGQLLSHYDLGVRLSFVTSWSSIGRTSLLVRPPDATLAELEPHPSVYMGARPGRKYSAGVAIKNNSTSAKDFRLDLIMSGVTHSSPVTTIASGASARLEVLERICPTPFFEDSYSPFGVGVWHPIAWKIVPTSTMTPADTFNVDAIFLGEGPSSTFILPDMYPSGQEVFAGTPIKLYAKNEGSRAWSDARVHVAAAGPIGTRWWVDVTTAPDLIPFISGYNRSVVVKSGSIAQGQVFPFWIRGRIDEHADPGVHRGVLRIHGD